MSIYVQKQDKGVHNIYIPPVRIMLIDTEMRPEIPKSLVDELEKEVEEFGEDKDGEPMKLYQLGGYSSKGEFIRDAVREKVERQKDRFLRDVGD